MVVAVRWNGRFSRQLNTYNNFFRGINRHTKILFVAVYFEVACTSDQKLGVKML